MRIRHVLVPTDFSDGSRAAFETAIDLARDAGAKLTLLHVNHMPAAVFPEAVLPIAPELMRDMEHTVDDMLEHLGARARALGVEAAWETTFGATHIEICEAAGRLGVDLIVMGTHGRTGLSHMLLGSVTEKVVRKAPCPVLTVRPEMGSTFAHP